MQQVYPNGPPRSARSRSPAVVQLALGVAASGLCLAVGIFYRFTHWNALRAFFRPGFLRSTMRESRASRPVKGVWRGAKGEGVKRQEGVPNGGQQQAR